MGRDGHESEPILDSNPFYVQRRVPQDVSWRWIYLISMVLSAVGGIYALTHRNKDFSVLASADYLSDPAHCPVIPAGRTRSLLANDDEDFKPTYFLEAAGLCTGVSIVGGLLIGLLALYLIRSKPHAMVGASVAMQVTLPAAAGVAVLAAGGGAASVPLFLTAGLIGFVFYLYRNQLALVGRLLGVSSRALYDNPSIIGGSLLIQLAGLIFVLPLLAGMLLAYANGGVAPNPAVQSRQGTSCLDGQGQEVLCCAWKPDDWAIAYMAWAAVTLSWTSLLAFTIKVFVISGVTAQWYFAPANQTPRGSLRRSIGHALGPQFGSLALAAWLLNLLNTLKQMAENARQENRNNLFVQILVSCLQFLITVLEYITKFGVVRIAITGEELMDGCRATVDLLRRNLLDTVGVWWFPGMILQVTALLLSGVWGLVVWGFTYNYWGGTKVALSSSIAMGLLAFLFGILTIGFINSILLNIVDAVYICFAMDRDAHACTRLEVHEVYSVLPSNKGPMGVVEQPDGEYAFGSAAADTAGPAAPHPYPSPAGAAHRPGAYPSIARV